MACSVSALQQNTAFDENADTNLSNGRVLGNGKFEVFRRIQYLRYFSTWHLICSLQVGHVPVMVGMCLPKLCLAPIPQCCEAHIPRRGPVLRWDTADPLVLSIYKQMRLIEAQGVTSKTRAHVERRGDKRSFIRCCDFMSPWCNKKLLAIFRYLKKHNWYCKYVERLKLTC